MPDFRYTKEEKLKKQKLIDALFARPKSVNAFPVRAFYAFPQERQDVCLKAGVGSGKKYFKRAVKRNRIKRLLREAWRLNKAALKQTLEDNNRQMLVFLHYSSRELPSMQEVNEKVSYIIKKLTEIANENPAQNS